MLDERRNFLWEVALHILASTPFLAATWYLFASTAGKPGSQDKRFLGLTCAVAAGIIIGRPLGALLAEPVGALFFPRNSARPEPGYSLADAQRKRGAHERAIEEYERIAIEFPTELRAHVAMLEIAVRNLNDLERARTIVTRSLATLPDETLRHELLRTYRTLTTRESIEEIV